ncbi:MAG: LLM class F420-dependent oxidoreductase [Actinomycetales bacterium]|nr:LLM class F420-dependent oxidoreductase [Actinomycetales bacterium]
MRIGVHVVRFDFPGGSAAIAPTLAAVGQAAEDAGLDNLSVMDHYFQMDGMGLGDAPAPMLEAYTTLGFLAAATTTVELQALVTGVTYRHPGLLAKIVTTLDVLSGGRAMLGIGAAWYEREHLGLGVPFPSTSERFERLAETLQIIHQMWSDDDGPYEGTYYRLAETMCSPSPLARPHPPIMIGGSGERKTLRLVARYADACNLFAGSGTSATEVKAKLDVLAQHCADAGTDNGRIRKTILWTGALDALTPIGATAFIEQMKAYADVGITEVRVMPMDDPVEFIRGLASNVIPALSSV